MELLTVIGRDLPGTATLTALAWLAAMLVGGLMTAHYRVSGLYRNGLLEGRKLGFALVDFLADQRRFHATAGALHLVATLLGAYGWGRLLAAAWDGPLGVRFYLVFGLTSMLAWSLGGLLLKMFAGSTAVNYARVVGTVFYPLCWVLRPWARFALGVMDRLDDSLWSADVQPHLSTDEIRSLISDEHQEGSLDEDEREMIQSIFSFHDTAVREIMIPRIDMVALDGAADLGEVIPTVIENGHSRLPVYDGSVDKVVGILYAKDLLKRVDEGRVAGPGNRVGDLARDAYFIPESKKIDEVLDEFRAKRIHMAVVIDEYGGTAGLVTLEDVIEEIVGEIEDEFDEEERLLTWLDASTVRLDPKINVEELEEALGVTFVGAAGAEDNETLGGLIYEAAGNVPAAGDEFEVAGLKVRVEKVVDQRMLQVVLAAPEPLPGYVRREES